MPQDQDRQISLEEFEEQRRKYYGIPTGLAASLRQQESGGRQYDQRGNVLTSPKRAKGRYQVLQSTADRYGLNVEDPFENVEAGFRYLSDLHKQVDKGVTDPGERWAQTLVGYHAGEGRLREMNKTGNLPSTSDGLIRTDEYVSNIMNRWQQHDTGKGAEAPEQMNFDLSGGRPTIDRATGLPSDLIPSASMRPQTARERRLAADETARRKAAPEIARLVEDFEALKRGGSVDAAKSVANKIKRQYGRWMEVGEGDGWPYVKSRIPGWDPVGPKAGPVGAEPPPRGAQGALNQFLQSAIKGTSAIPEGFAELVRSLPRNDEIDVFNKLIEEGKTPEEAQKELPAKLAEYQTQRNRNEAIKRDFRPITDRGAAFAERVAPIDPTDKSYLTAKIPAALGGTVPFAVGTVLTGGNPVTGAVLGASANAQQVAREFDAAGVDPEKRDRAIRMAGATGLTEMFGVSRALNKFGMSRPFIKRAVDILEESGQEGLQQYLNNVNAVMNYDPNRPLDQGVLENVITGGVTGGVLQGASAAGAKMASRASLNPAAQPAVAPETGVRIIRQGETPPARTRNERQIPMDIENPDGSVETVLVIAPRRMNEVALRQEVESSIRNPAAPVAQPETVVTETTIPPARPKGRIVNVGGKGFTLTPEQEARWAKEIDEPLALAKQRFADDQQSVGRQEAQKRQKAVAMRIAAVKREIVGAFTEKEQAAKVAREATNYRGKPVSVDINGQRVNGAVQGQSFGRVRVKLEDGQVVTVKPEQVRAPESIAPPEPLPSPRNTRGAIIAPESPLGNQRLLPPASTQPMPAPVIYPDAPITDQMPEIRDRITAENAPTTEQPIVMGDRQTADLSQKRAAPESQQSQLLDQKGAENERRTAEIPRVATQEPSRQPTERLGVPEATDENIGALQARQEELGRLAYDRRGSFTGDLRDEYNELTAAIREYENARTPRELGPPPGREGRMTPPTAEIPARRQALESRPRTSGLLQASTPGRPVTADAQIPSSRNPRTDFSSREDARQGYFDTLTDDELVAEISRMEDVKNTAVRGKSKLTPDEISANNFDLKIATAMQKERRRLQQQIGVDPANRIPVRTPGRAERKIQHGTFGLVTEVADQSGVPKGKLKVVGEDGASHIIQNPRTRGNREATFVKAATPKYEIPAEAMPEMKGRSMPRPITPRQPTSTGAIPAEAMPEMRQPRGQIMGMGFGSLQGLFERGGKAKQVAPEGVEPPPSPGRDVRWYDYLRSPLSNLNYKGTYERLAGKAGEEISEAFRQAQLNIAKDESSRGTQIRQLEKTLRGYKEQLRAEGKPGLANWLDEHVNGLHDPDSAFRGLAGFLKGFQYHSKLRFNPRSIIVNELQPLQTLWPHLTTREFLKIAAQARRKETRTRIAELLGKEVAGKVEGVDAKRRFDPFATVSESNRAMGYLAGELMANRMGLTGDAKARMAADWAKKVEFDNSRWDVPPLFRGRLASVVGQFKPFMIKNLERLYADWKEAPQGSGSGNLARRSKMIASQLAIGGVRSMLLPGIKEVGGVLILGGLANALTKAGMDEDDANKLAEAVYFGAPGLIEQDLSGSVMLLDTPMGNTPAEKTVNFLGGPTISLIVKAWKEGETLAGAKDSKEMKESALRLAKTVTPYTKTAETVYNLAVERKAPNLKLGKKETPMTTAETIGYGLMGTPLRQTKHYEEEETFDWQRRMLGKPRKAGELGAFGGRLDAELRKHGLDYSKVSEIPGDTERTHRARTAKIEQWMRRYGGALVNSSAYRSLRLAEQKEAIENLRRRVGAQANQRTPDLGNFNANDIVDSVRESIRSRPERNRRKLVFE